MFIFYPRGRPTVNAGSDHYFHTCHLSGLYFHPRFQNLAKFNFQVKIVTATCGTVGLAEWIIFVPPIVVHISVISFVERQK